jgi:hypothetical protein
MGATLTPSGVTLLSTVLVVGEAALTSGAVDTSARALLADGVSGHEQSQP